MEKKQMKMGKRIYVIVLVAFLLLPSTQAQFLRTSYFMEGSTHRHKLNPALRPTRGYIDLPVVGSLNVWAASNSLGTQDIIDIIDSDGKFYNNEDFMGRLSDENKVNVSFNTDVISFGFYKGKGFWTFNAGLRNDINASIPKTLFDYMREVDADDYVLNKTFDICNQQVNANSYVEVALGHSREINDRLTVGAKVKFLAGAANMKLQINKMMVSGNMPSRREIQDLTWDDLNKLNMSAEIAVDATMEGAFKGLELEENENGYIHKLKLGNFGVAGYGGAIDLGFSYKLLDNLTLSAAINDLGFIAWNKDASRVASSSVSEHYDKSNYREFYDRYGNGDVIDFDLLQLEEKQADKGRSTTLASTLVVGAEYGMLNNKVSFGVLSTTRFCELETISEVTLSANYRPKSWFNAAVSYSMIQSLGKSFGVAAKIGPLMIGTDYMFLGNNTKSTNAYLGISLPLGASK